MGSGLAMLVEPVGLCWAEAVGHFPGPFALFTNTPYTLEKLLYNPHIQNL